MEHELAVIRGALPVATLVGRGEKADPNLSVFAAMQEVNRTNKRLMGEIKAGKAA